LFGGDYVPGSDFQAVDEYGQAAPRPVSPVQNKNKVGRNDLCPCGSGKKYKKCCLKD